VGRLYIDKDVEITPKCVEGRVFSISSSQLQRNDPKFFFSDIYVRTLASLPSNYSIIEVRVRSCVRWRVCVCVVCSTLMAVRRTNTMWWWAS
jgi:hypothetical protein